MSVFDRLEAMTSAAVDNVFAEPLIIIPMLKASPNSRARPDPGRDQTVCEGIFDYKSEDRGVRTNYGEPRNVRAFHAGRTPVISVDRRHFPQGQGPRQGDIARLPTRDDLPDFDVVSATPDGHSRIKLMLSPRGEADA